MAAKAPERCSQQHSCTSRMTARSPPCRCSTAARTRSSPWAQRRSGCRWASGRRRSPLTALSRTGGLLQSSQRSRHQEAGRELAEFSSHPLPQGLILAWGPVGEQMHECINVKIPQIVWAELCVLFLVSYLASLFLALLLNTSAQFTLMRIICLVFYTVKIFTVQGEPPMSVTTMENGITNERMICLVSTLIVSSLHLSNYFFVSNLRYCIGNLLLLTLLTPAFII
jgi:hypothetical protein